MLLIAALLKGCLGAIRVRVVLFGNLLGRLRREHQLRGSMLRITSGQFRGRMIHTPSGEKTRPTQSRLRQALFNSIQTHVGEARVLDLFSGSGALGFEALSRGASQVVFVELSRAALGLIEKNAHLLDVTDQVRTLSGSVSDLLERIEKLGPFDLVLADPPYAEGWEMKLLETFPWEKVLVPGGLFCLEWGRTKSVISELPDHTPSLQKIREKIYGDSVLSTYQREERA